MCVAWTQYERTTNAVEVSTHLDASTQRAILRACADFFRDHLAREPSKEVAERTDQIFIVQHRSRSS